MEKFISKLVYLPKPWTSISYFLLVIAALILFFGRNLESLRIPFLLAWITEFYTHISNFSLILMVYTAVGYMALLFDVKTRFLLVLALAFGGINMITESFITILNTPDLTDAYFGYAAVSVALTYLLIVKNYGLNPNPLLNQKA